MTSYERPDAGLLVEHLLPSLLGTSYAPSREVGETALFFGELCDRLRPLRGSISVISSPASAQLQENAPRQERQYPWLWRYVEHVIVGRQSNAVQHAKLWAFHWSVGQEQYLELHVSSTNLTEAAFKGQLQAGWQVMLHLDDSGTQRKERSWGPLVPFLEALGASAGNVAEERLRRLIELLRRVECPADVTFVASIPGKRSAARQLKPFGFTELHLLTPTIGEWNAKKLAAWSADAGIALGKTHLKWISVRHPWVEKSGWTLSTSTCEQLVESGVWLDHLPADARFTEQHRDADPRWSHAKLYLLRRRRKRSLLVTSANWSVAAWGAGTASPRNFELGVLFACEWAELEAWSEPFDGDVTPYCVDRSDDDELTGAVGWAEATWDGESIKLYARSSDLAAGIDALVCFAGGTERQLSFVGGNGVLAWTDPEQPPLTAHFSLTAAIAPDSQALEVDVIDLRAPAAFARTPLPEVDPALAKALSEALLLQRYGGPAVDLEDIAGAKGDRSAPGPNALASDYSVVEWVDARESFQVIDRWQETLRDAQNDSSNLLRSQHVLLDGEQLRALYAARVGVGAQLAVEELSWRLREAQ